MSDKKKKKKGGDKAATASAGGDGMAAKLDAANERTLEYYESKLRDMTEKVERLKTKCDNLTKDNEILAKAQSKSNHDKQDIVEFLNIRVGEHEKMIASLESKTRQLDEEKRELEIRSKNEVENIRSSMQSDLEILQIQCAKYKAELSELTAFSTKKDEMELQIKQYKALLEKKESEYRDTIHNLERKVLQDKNQMKREMLQKVNEAVANFRRVADQQMAETTKRAIRENMVITTQLKKMSSKTIELIAENDMLTSKITKLKTNNTLLNESEQELAKRNQANQRVIKMLVEKLKESDQMLELAFESEQLGQNQGNNDGNGYNNANGSSEYLTEEMKEEIEALQSDYNVLAARLTEVANVTDELELAFQDVFGNVETEEDYDNLSAEVLDYMRSSLIGIVERLKTLTWFESSETQSQENEESDVPQMQITIDAVESQPELNENRLNSGDDADQKYYIDEENEEDDKDQLENTGGNSGGQYFNGSVPVFDSADSIEQYDDVNVSDNRLMAESGEFSDGIRNEGSDPYGSTPIDQNDQRAINDSYDSFREVDVIESRGSSSVQSRTIQISKAQTASTASQTASEDANLAVSYILRPNKRLTGYQQKIERNFMSMISTIPSRRKPAGNLGTTNLPLGATIGTPSLTTVRVRGGGKQRDVGMQTKPLAFGQKVNGSFLLGELRPWGVPADCLPKKGLGLYKARTLPREPQPLENRTT